MAVLDGDGKPVAPPGLPGAIRAQAQQGEATAPVFRCRRGLSGQARSSSCPATSTNSISGAPAGGDPARWGADPVPSSDTGLAPTGEVSATSPWSAILGRLATGQRLRGDAPARRHVSHRLLASGPRGDTAAEPAGGRPSVVE